MANRTELMERIEKLLDIYTLDDILEYNDVEPSEALELLYLEGKIEFPPEPC